MFKGIGARGAFIETLYITYCICSNPNTQIRLADLFEN